MGRITLFRPEQNALRMQMGADRLCMTPPSVDQFVEAVKQTVIANKKWVWPMDYCVSLSNHLLTIISS